MDVGIFATLLRSDGLSTAGYVAGGRDPALLLLGSPAVDRAVGFRGSPAGYRLQPDRGPGRWPGGGRSLGSWPEVGGFFPSRGCTGGLLRRACGDAGRLASTSSGDEHSIGSMCGGRRGSRRTSSRSGRSSPSGWETSIHITCPSPSPRWGSWWRGRPGGTARRRGRPSRWRCSSGWPGPPTPGRCRRRWPASPCCCCAATGGGTGPRRWTDALARGGGCRGGRLAGHRPVPPLLPAPFQGVGTVSAWTEPATLLLFAGCLLIPAFLRPSPCCDQSGASPNRRAAGEDPCRRRGGHDDRRSERPTVPGLADGGGRDSWLWVFLDGGERNERPALALAMLGVFLFAVPEVLYVVDSYGDRLHRMNTVFKSYIQAWILLAAALPALPLLACPPSGRAGSWPRCSSSHPAASCVDVLNQISDRPLGLDGHGLDVRG